MNSKESLLSRLKPKLKSSVPFIYYPLKKIKIFLQLLRIRLKSNFNKDGLNKTEKRDKKIIVSMSSYPARIKTTAFAIASILNQTMKPDKIILWLGEDKFPDKDKNLPKIFDKVKKCGVEIRFCEDLGPHKKYFFAMQEYPDDLLITFDDDIIYNNNVIETLYKSYLEHPDCISAMRVCRITFSPDGSMENYDDWEHAFRDTIMRDPNKLKSHRYLATNVGGTIYQPYLFHQETLNFEAIKQLCPKADDIWLKIMEIMSGTKVVLATYRSLIHGKEIPDTQTFALWKTNVTGGEDIKQLQACIDKYNNWTVPSTGKTILEIMYEDAE